jgi:hypothetical protein
MNYEELKRRFRKEELDRYYAYHFDELWGGGYISMCIRKNKNSTISYCFTDERGSIIAEHLDMPEAEACEDIYKFAVSTKEYAEYKGIKPAFRPIKL